MDRNYWKSVCVCFIELVQQIWLILDRINPCYLYGNFMGWQVKIKIVLFPLNSDYEFSGSGSYIWEFIRNSFVDIEWDRNYWKSVCVYFIDLVQQVWLILDRINPCYLCGDFMASLILFGKLIDQHVVFGCKKFVCTVYMENEQL